MVIERTGDTRSRIKAVALQLFSEQGYEKTSLREIAERLGVTKAALYYHFKSKDEIVASFVDDRVADMNVLIDWAREQPPGPATRRAVLRRYAALLNDETHPRLMRFFEQNQPALKTMPAGKLLRDRLFELVRVLTDPAASPADELRTALALFGLHTARFGLLQRDLTDEERTKVALDVAYELVDPLGRGAAGQGDPQADEVHVGSR
jgi:AcrR family transcriptional regulator